MSSIQTFSAFREFCKYSLRINDFFKKQKQKANADQPLPSGLCFVAEYMW